MNINYIKIPIILLLITFTCVFCGKQGKKSDDNSDKATEEEKIIQRTNELGKEIVQSTFNALSTALNSAIQQGGVQNAIEYCSIKAIPLTDSMSEIYNVNISRVSHLYRNPVNKANEHEMELIEMYRELLDSGKDLTPRTIKLNGKSNYYAPILINNQLCLNCHGVPGIDVLDEDLIYIHLLYPEDHAINFEMGQIRGLWRIEFTEEVL